MSLQPSLQIHLCHTLRNVGHEDDEVRGRDVVLIDGRLHPLLSESQVDVAAAQTQHEQAVQQNYYVGTPPVELTLVGIQA